MKSYQEKLDTVYVKQKNDKFLYQGGGITQQREGWVACIYLDLRKK